MATRLTSCAFLLHWIIFFYAADIFYLCGIMTISAFEWDTSPGTQRLRRQTAEGGVCELPEPLKHGKYRVNSMRCPPEKQTPACLLVPGAYIPPGWILHYTCDEGYESNINLTVVVCHRGRWAPAIPVCNRLKMCPPLRSFAVEIRCTFGGYDVSCAHPMIPGTIAVQKCKEGYQLPYQSEPSQLTCLDYGTWDFPPLYCTPAPACLLSDTLVNGKSVCKGDVVFEDTFNEPLSSKWRHFIAFGFGTWKFNVLTSDSKNSFTRYSNLVIKPTLYNDSFVTSASVGLKGCSATGGQCVRTGSPDKILPPVASASLATRTFSFMYGEVEIRAKVPKGDWLMPSMTLESKQHYYGKGDTSGCVYIGMTLGNSDLRCGGDKYGFGRVENRIHLGPENNARRKEYVIPNLSEKWYDQYHIYTVIWKPGSIVFKFDNELVEEISPEGTLCETYSSLTKEECMIYSSGSKLAPFDKEFYINLALLAGDLWTDTDGCMNRGKVKPWKFNEPQETLKFWQDRENWLPTWTEEGSSLYIDYVRVTAV